MTFPMTIFTVRLTAICFFCVLVGILLESVEWETSHEPKISILNIFLVIQRGLWKMVQHGNGRRIKMDALDIHRHSKQIHSEHFPRDMKAFIGIGS